MHLWAHVHFLRWFLCLIMHKVDGLSFSDTHPSSSFEKWAHIPAGHHCLFLQMHSNLQNLPLLQYKDSIIMCAMGALAPMICFVKLWVLAFKILWQFLLLSTLKKKQDWKYCSLLSCALLNGKFTDKYV